ncbi:MAG: aldo/keto reductase, partial [Spirochaetes bacterium]|nr:aldo/keto reductase [Spirochaetota bacterium]
EILTANGRTPAQGALCWIWGKDHLSVPIPGFKNTKQITDNAKSLEFGPLSQSQMDEIEQILNFD